MCWHFSSCLWRSPSATGSSFAAPGAAISITLVYAQPMAYCFFPRISSKYALCPAPAADDDWQGVRRRRTTKSKHKVSTSSATSTPTTSHTHPGEQIPLTCPPLVASRPRASRHWPKLASRRAMEPLSLQLRCWSRTGALRLRLVYPGQTNPVPG